MEGLEGLPCLATSTASVDTNSPPCDLEHAAEISPVGSQEDVAEQEIIARPSDEDRDHDHLSGMGVSADDLKHKIVKQVEYYFSDENLPTDKYLMNLIRKNKEGFVPMAIIASFRKMKKLTQAHTFIVAALRESSLLAVSSDGKKVKRLNPMQFEVRDPKLYTVLVENLPEDHSEENIQRIFSEAGKIKSVSFHDPNASEELAKRSKPGLLISSKLHALVEYETIEAAEKAAATLNNEQDWRNGMHVKLYKRMGKYGQRKQGWRGSESEKNSIQVLGQSGDEKNHNSNEHHDDTPDEEDGEHLSKEKNGQRGRNRGRSRKHKYSANGMGHGTSLPTHPVEASRAPPGPKMPDGTRGFAIGRGRPLVSN